MIDTIDYYLNKFTVIVFTAVNYFADLIEPLPSAIQVILTFAITGIFSFMIPKWVLVIIVTVLSIALLNFVAVMLLYINITKQKESRY